VRVRLSFVTPRQELRSYIQSFWVCESATGIALSDRNIAVPNGCSKLIIPYANALSGISDDRAGVSREHGLYFVGNRIKATLIHSSARKTGFIGIEFFPHAAFTLFGIPMHETVDEKIFDSEVLFGRWGKQTREVLCNLEELGAKVAFIQDKLVKLSRAGQGSNGVVEFCVNALKLAHGRMPIKELEQKTGYSRRYLDILFRQRVGLPPKVLAGIFRFQMLYRKWAEGLSYDLLKESAYDYYYDQAHFSKEFRRMTGYTPREFMTGASNGFGRRLSLK
jgi:AraC-like DNA-binding protein